MVLNPSIKKVTPTTPPVAVASYDYTDIANGTGIQSFYGAQATSSGAAIQYILVTDEGLYSNVIAEKSTWTGARKLLSNVNYDVKFNLPQQIKGDAYVSFSQGAHKTAGITSTNVKVNLYHVNKDGTELLMASGESNQTKNSGANNDETDTVTLPLDITKRWLFKKDEILRLNMNLYGTGGTAGISGYGCDPKDRDDILTASGGIVIENAYTTQLKLQVPFLIDI